MPWSTLGCRLREIVEPALDPSVAATTPGLTAYTRLPNFLIVSAEAPA
ncbi:hypothetical protein [Kribbella capetownensis]|nr:hypothetical protein [Kribbella capetownensis]